MNQIIALRGAPAGAAGRFASARTLPRANAPIVVETCSLAQCVDIRADWCDLAARALEPNLFFEPDFLLAAAQHLVPFRNVSVMLAWQGERGDPQRRLAGLMPFCPRGRIFGPDALVGFADARIANCAPLLDRELTEAVLTAMLRTRPETGPGKRGLLLGNIDLESRLVQASLRVAEGLGLSATLTPQRRRPLPRPAIAGLNTELKLVETGASAKVRDVVEILLAMQASGEQGRAGTAILQNTREAGFVRAMTRSLTRNRQCRAALLLHNDRAVAGVILLGPANRSFVYMATHDDAHAGDAPVATLIAKLRQARPDRTLVAPADDEGFGELRLMSHAALKPHDLALRAGHALRRTFRLPDARRAG